MNKTHGYANLENMVSIYSTFSLIVQGVLVNYFPILTKQRASLSLDFDKNEINYWGEE